MAGLLDYLFNPPGAQGGLFAHLPAWQWQQQGGGFPPMAQPQQSTTQPAPPQEMSAARVAPQPSMPMAPQLDGDNNPIPGMGMGGGGFNLPSLFGGAMAQAPQGGMPGQPQMQLQPSPMMGQPQPEGPGMLQRLANTGGAVGGFANFLGAVTGTGGRGVNPETSTGPAGQVYRMMLAKGVDPAAAKLMASQKETALAWVAAQMKPQGTDDIREFEYAKGQGFKGTLEDWMARKRGGAGEFGLTPVWGTDKDGNTVMIQPGKSGTAIQSVLPEGVKLSTGVDKIDLGTQWALQDRRSGQIVGYLPKDIAGAEQQKVIGKGQGEASEALTSMRSKMPGLQTVVEKLGTLADKATYTMAGKTIDSAMRQAGMEPRDAAVARAEYTAMVDNQILPLLRDTFGAQFTEREGATLKATLGDPDRSPAEKHALLKAFIEQKARDIEALEARTGVKPAAAPAAAKSGTTKSGIQWSVQ
jgi:hypothetical protein